MKTKANNVQSVTIKITIRKMCFYVPQNNTNKRNGKFLKKSTLYKYLLTLIKNKIKLSSYIRKFTGIGCKVIYN